jgi:hypothetical protein
MTSHLAFITAAPRPTSGIAGLDAVCQAEASAAVLTGTFRAAAATTTSSIKSRFPIDYQPIVRVDGTRVADNVIELMSSPYLRSFVNQQADSTYVHGVEIATGAVDPQTLGTTQLTCSDWTSADPAMFSTAGDPTSTEALRFWGRFGLPCSAPARILCISLESRAGWG